jgi:bacteriocin leader peptide (microcyclamide/patellamide family)
MNKKNIFPQQTQPVERVTQGTQSDLLAELSEEVLSLGGNSARSIMASSELLTINNIGTLKCYCSYDGD